MWRIMPVAGDATNAKIWQESKIHVVEAAIWATDRPVLLSDSFQQLAPSFLYKRRIADLQVVKDVTGSGALGVTTKCLESLGCPTPWAPRSKEQAALLDAERSPAGGNALMDQQEGRQAALLDAEHPPVEHNASDASGQLVATFDDAKQLASIAPPGARDNGRSLQVILSCSDGGSDEKDCRSKIKAQVSRLAHTSGWRPTVSVIYTN